MKVRADFVTNSSSSSFISVRITNAALYDALLELGGDEGGSFYIDGDPIMESDGDGVTIFEVSSDFDGLAEGVTESIEGNLSFIERILEFCESEALEAFSETKDETTGLRIDAQEANTEGDISVLSATFEYDRDTGVYRFETSDELNDCAKNLGIA